MILLKYINKFVKVNNFYFILFYFVLLNIYLEKIMFIINSYILFMNSYIKYYGKSFILKCVKEMALEFYEIQRGCHNTVIWHPFGGNELL